MRCTRPSATRPLLSPLLLCLAGVFVGAAAATGISDPSRCVFLHGVGTPNSSAVTAEDTDGYWGGQDVIAKYTSYCSTRVFLHQDTVKRGWDDPDLQRAACDAAVGQGADGVVRDTIVISHSMGNLFFAEALRRGVCSFDDSSSKWISIEAPWLGSKAAPWVSTICSNETTSSALRWLAGKLHYCDPDVPGKVYRGYETLQPSFPGLANLPAVAQAHVTKALCGASAFGLTSVYSAAFEALAAEVNYGDDNDGMVAVSSCQLPGKDYKKHYAEDFYLAEINHADGTCRAGNGIWGLAARQPCLWLASAMGNTTAFEELAFVATGNMTTERQPVFV
mmetsp:Transcript_95545/g.239431  ORF Transcript_95545/g.239431 Transcript_95545/m.239431 type:complete len:335 (+) Transcript_95545:196-1200(+)